MSHDFIDELMEELNRVITPDVKRLKEVLVVSGMPRKTENLRYLSFNRQILEQENKVLDFSAVAIINNRRIPQWRLSGYKKKISQIIFSTRWTRNPLDLFINNLRCNPELMDILEGAKSDYSLLGILKVKETRKGKFRKRKFRFTRPVVIVPRLDPESLQKVKNFEDKNEITKSSIKGFSYYRKTGMENGTK